MNTKLVFLLIALTMAIVNVKAQDVVKVRTTGNDISDNLNLEAVASMFAESENLTDFERRLNDAGNKISNLNLNEDGYVDYLRVVEYTENGTHLITIQAILGEDIFQDVATIELEKEDGDQYSMIIVGNHFLYGNDFMIRLVYVHRPSIFSFFWGPLYRPWHSPYYWGYYPTYYTYRAPFTIHRYRNHIHHHINYHHHYEYISHRDRRHSDDFYTRNSRNDYESKHPDKSFENRNHGVKNSFDLNQNRRSGRKNMPEYNRSENSTQNKEGGHRSNGTFKKREKETPVSVDRSTKKEEPRQSVRQEKTVKEPSQNKSKSIFRHSNKRSKSKSADAKKSAPARTKSKSQNDQKQDSRS
jgi:hypothetical protein